MLNPISNVKWELYDIDLNKEIHKLNFCDSCYLLLECNLYTKEAFVRLYNNDGKSLNHIMPDLKLPFTHGYTINELKWHACAEFGTQFYNYSKKMVDLEKTLFNVAEKLKYEEDLHLKTGD